MQPPDAWHLPVAAVRSRDHAHAGGKEASAQDCRHVEGSKTTRTRRAAGTKGGAKTGTSKDRIKGSGDGSYDDATAGVTTGLRLVASTRPTADSSSTAPTRPRLTCEDAASVI